MQLSQSIKTNLDLKDCLAQIIKKQSSVLVVTLSENVCCLNSKKVSIIWYDMNSKNVFIDLFVSSGMYSWLITQKIAALTYMSSEKYVQFDNSCQYWFI